MNGSLMKKWKATANNKSAERVNRLALNLSFFARGEERKREILIRFNNRLGSTHYLLCARRCIIRKYNNSSPFQKSVLASTTRPNKQQTSYRKQRVISTNFLSQRSISLPARYYGIPSAATEDSLVAKQTIAHKHIQRRISPSEKKKCYGKKRERKIRGITWWFDGSR